MKYHSYENPTRSAKRVLDSFVSTLLNLLSIKSFDEITVNEISEESSYPRATFYNYFDDKYDLLNYFWYRLALLVIQDSVPDGKHDIVPAVLFERIYDLLAEHENNITAILSLNSFESYFFVSCKMYLQEVLKQFFSVLPTSADCPIPRELFLEHQCNILLMLLEWRFKRSTQTSKKQIFEYAKFLLGDYI